VSPRSRPPLTVPRPDLAEPGGRAVRLLVAHESEAIRQAVRRLGEDAGYEVVSAADGEAALARALADRPDVMVIDVALPRLLGYQVVDRVRERGLKIRTILVASVYNRTGYKRRPSTLHGADDYIEQHHIADHLLWKIARLLPPGRAPRIGPPDPGESAQIRRAGEARLRLRYASLDEGIERARRLARLIVADIALYCGQHIAEGLQHGDLEVRLRDDLEEGRLLFDLRVPEEIRRTRDFIAEALAEHLAERAGRHGQGPEQDRKKGS